MPTIRESVQALKALLEQPVQRGSAPGTAPVQSPDPAKKPKEKEPEKGKGKKLRFRVGKQGEGEVAEALDYPKLAGQLRAKTIEFYGEWRGQLRVLIGQYEKLLEYKDQLDAEDAEEMAGKLGLLHEIGTAVAHLRKSFDE